MVEYENVSWDTSEELKKALRLVRDFGFISESKAKLHLSNVEKYQYMKEEKLREEFKARGKMLDNLAESRGWK